MAQATAVRAAVSATAAVLLMTACTATPDRSTTTPPASPSTSGTTPAATGTRSPTTASATPLPSPAAGTQWLTYQHDAVRSGATSGGLTPTRVAWSAKLGGGVHGEVVAADGRLFAATDTNRVVALDPRTGHVVWSRVVGPPLRNVVAAAGCGNLDPLGVTSTPVVDTTSHTVYVVAEISSAATTVHHQLFGLSTTTGRVTLSRSVDPPLPTGERAIHLLQRDALALANGRVYVGFGGNSGDCGTYHGWVVGAPVSGSGANTAFEVDRGGQGGAVWQSGGGPAIDTAGNVYVTTGNSNPWPNSRSDPGENAESVVELSASLNLLHSFKDPVASQDADLSTGNPVLLPGGLVFAAGKTDIAYLLRASDLGKVAQIAGLCGSDPDGGPAYDAATHILFVPCREGGIQEVDIARRRLGPRLSGANSTPILVGNRLFAMAYGRGVVYEYDASTGHLIRTLPSTGEVPHFASPSTAFGLLLAPTNAGVAAYR